MRTTKIAFSVILFASILYAIPMLEPFQKEVADGEEIYIGEIGPGQTVSISVDGRPTTGGIHQIGGAYEIASAIEIPEGWSTKKSDWAGIPLQVKIIAAKNAPEGEYRAKIEVHDEDDSEKLGNITFFVKMNITYDILDASLDNTVKETVSGQPARFYITITNKANTGDTFTVSSTNIRGWEFKKSIYVAAKSSKTLQYEVISKEEEQYSPLISVVSDSSALINKTLNASVIVHPSLFADLKAINNGMLLFPAMNGIIYALAGLISNLF